MLVARTLMVILAIALLSNGSASAQSSVTPDRQPEPPAIEMPKNNIENDAPATSDRPKPSAQIPSIHINIGNFPAQIPKIIEGETMSSNSSHDNRWIKWLTDPTLIIAVGTLGLMCVTFWQVKISKTNMTSTQRAFVFLKSVDFYPMRGRDNRVREFAIEPAWENSGQTPTRHLSGWVSAKTFDREGIPDSYEFPDINNTGEMRRYVLGPGTVVGAAHIPIHIVDAEPVRSGNKRLFIWGWAEYNDIFKKTPKHRTEFCVEIVLAGPSFPEDTTMTWIVHNKHNGADEECMKKPSASASAGLSQP